MQGRSSYALIFLLLSFVSCGAGPCIKSAILKPSTVSITRYFDEAERAIGADLAGIQGTGWFMSPTTLVTVEHVAAAMRLSTQLDTAQCSGRRRESGDFCPRSAFGG